MKICVAQTRPVRGDVQSNIDDHKRLIELACFHGVEIIIFPELSLTGYEPELAKKLATDINDSRFDDFQKISDVEKIIIGVGMPTKGNSGILINMIIFNPCKPRQIYSKQYLHSDEVPYFINAEHQSFLIKDKIALAICYELSVPEHSENAHKSGAEIYVASVAKTIDGVEKAIKTLSDIANKYSMTALMSNCIGPCDNFESAGKTSIWNNNGALVSQLNDTNEGILIIDTSTQKVIKETI